MGNGKTWNVFGILLMLSVMMVFGFSLSVRAAGENRAEHLTPENLFVTDGQGTIIQYTGSDTVVVVPPSIQGKTVTGLAGTFMNNTTVKRILLPNTIQVFGDDTFNGCTNLALISIYKCGHVFSKAEIEDIHGEFTPYIWYWYVYVSDTEIYRIEDCAGCVIPVSLTTLGQRVFNSCAFNDFYVEEGNTAFKIWNDPSIVFDPNDINVNPDVGPCLISLDGNTLYRFAPGYHHSGSYLLPPVTTIRDYALESVSKNGGFEIPNTVTTIGSYAFYHADNTTFINFQENSKVTTIGSFAFANINNLGNGGIFTLPASVTTVGEYCFAYCQNIQIDLSKSSLISIPAFIFKDSNNLHEITLPATVRTIEAYAFYECDNFNNIYFLGDTLDKIGEAAFKGCNNLHAIKIPEGVKAIENDTFSGCQNLNDIELPNSLEIIGDNAFAGCQNIHHMVIPENVTYISNTTFDGVDPEKLSGVDTSKNEYAQTRIKKELPKKGDMSIRDNLVYEVTQSHATNGTVTVVKAVDKKQKSITIPATVNINGYDFKVTAIANKAFKKNTKLKSVTIGDNIKTIGKEAFSGCKALKTITVKSKVVSKVNKNAFKGINKKAKIKLPKMNSKKFKKYKKKFEKKGQAATVKITK